MVDTVFYIYLLVVLAVAVIAAVRLPTLSPSLRCLAALMIAVPLTEGMAIYSAFSHRNNYPVYNVYSIVEFALTMLYFHFSNSYLRRNGFALILMTSGILFGIANLIWIQNIAVPAENFTALEIVTIIIVSVYSAYRLMVYEPESKFSNNLHYTVIVLILSNWLLNYVHWGMGTLIEKLFENGVINLFHVTLVINALISIGYGFIFLNYTKYPRTA